MRIYVSDSERLFNRLKNIYSEVIGIAKQEFAATI